MKNEPAKSIEAYIAQFDGEINARLIEIRELIKKTAPDAIEKISWGMPTFYYKENLIHFAAFKQHIGIYPGEEAIVAFQDKIQHLKSSKGAIQLPNNVPLPTKLIIDIVQYRLDLINNS